MGSDCGCLKGKLNRRITFHCDLHEFTRAHDVRLSGTFANSIPTYFTASSINLDGIRLLRKSILYGYRPLYRMWGTLIWPTYRESLVGAAPCMVLDLTGSEVCTGRTINHQTRSFLGFALIIQVYGFLISKQSTHTDTQLVYLGQNCQPQSITDLQDRDQRQYVPANRRGAMHQCISSGAVDTHPVPGIRVISRYLLALLLASCMT
jgi:hypothetical protein